MSTTIGRYVSILQGPQDGREKPNHPTGGFQWIPIYLLLDQMPSGSHDEYHPHRMRFYDKKPETAKDLLRYRLCASIGDNIQIGVFPSVDTLYDTVHEWKPRPPPNCKELNMLSSFVLTVMSDGRHWIFSCSDESDLLQMLDIFKNIAPGSCDDADLKLDNEMLLSAIQLVDGEEDIQCTIDPPIMSSTAGFVSDSKSEGDEYLSSPLFDTPPASHSRSSSGVSQTALNASLSSSIPSPVSTLSTGSMTSTGSVASTGSLVHIDSIPVSLSNHSSSNHNSKINKTTSDLDLVERQHNQDLSDEYKSSMESLFTVSNVPIVPKAVKSDTLIPHIDPLLIPNPPSSEVDASFTKSPISSLLGSLSSPQPSSGKGSELVSTAASTTSPSVINLSTPHKPARSRSKDVYQTMIFNKVFNLPRETLLGYYYCSLLKIINLSGMLYITSNYICFYSLVFGYKVATTISFESVKHLECLDTEIKITITNDASRDVSLESDATTTYSFSSLTVADCLQVTQILKDCVPFAFESLDSAEEDVEDSADSPETDSANPKKLRKKAKKKRSLPLSLNFGKNLPPLPDPTKMLDVGLNKVVDGFLDCTVPQLWHCFFKDWAPHSFTDFQREVQEDTEIRVSGWKLLDSVPPYMVNPASHAKFNATFDMTGATEIATREFVYRTKLITPTTNTTMNLYKLLTVGRWEEEVDGKIVHRIGCTNTSFTPEAPFGENFYIVERWNFRDCEEGVKVEMSTGVNVVNMTFLMRPIIGILKSRAKEDSGKQYNGWLQWCQGKVADAKSIEVDAFSLIVPDKVEDDEECEMEDVEAESVQDDLDVSPLSQGDTSVPESQPVKIGGIEIPINLPINLPVNLTTMTLGALCIALMSYFVGGSETLNVSLMLVLVVVLLLTTQKIDALEQQVHRLQKTQ